MSLLNRYLDIKTKYRQSAMINQNYYPGMINSEIEFFTTGETLTFIQNGKMLPFSKIDSTIYKMLKDEMHKDIDAHLALMDWHPNNEQMQVEQFTKCRYGGLDFNADITASGRVQKGEYWECPLRTNCKSAGLVCKNIKVHHQPITIDEVQLIKLLVTDMTNDVIAMELKIALGTLHLKKRVLYEKLEISTKQELTIFAFQYNIIHTN